MTILEQSIKLKDSCDLIGWAKEHDNLQYIINLLFSVITVSFKTVGIVEGLPMVEWG